MSHVSSTVNLYTRNGITERKSTHVETNSQDGTWIDNVKSRAQAAITRDKLTSGTLHKTGLRSS